MGVLTTAAGPAPLARVRDKRAIHATVAAYAVLTAITVYFHEPWADEANSWLLGRDASLVQLWTRLMHYEGTPALWQTLLHILIRLGLPYSGLNVFSGLVGFAAACIFIYKAPLPLPLRLAFPFTFYLFYQYSIVARSYCLLPLLLFLCAVIYPRAKHNLGLFTLLLCLMAGVSVHGMILSGSIWLVFQLDAWRQADPVDRKKIWLLAAVYGAAVILFAASAWPAPDQIFAPKRNYSLANFFDIASDTVAGAFTGERITSWALLILCLPFFRKGRALALFLLPVTALCAFNSVIYGNVWHEGMPFLAWLFAIWIAAQRIAPGRLALAAMSAIIAVQIYWSFETARYDWRNPYSGSREVAHYLRAHGIANSQLYGFGFGCVGIQPYFSRNIFANFGQGRPQAYWDWSEAYRNFTKIEELASVHPSYIVVGYKTEEEQILTRNKIKKDGYELFLHVEGNLYWQDDILEPDAFDLYRVRTGQ